MRSPGDEAQVSNEGAKRESTDTEMGKGVCRVTGRGIGSNSLDRKKTRPRNRQTGFTIIELLITMAVIVTISAIAVPNLLAAIDSARVARAVGDIRALEDGISLYQVVNGGLPDDLSQVGYVGMLDPWRNPYQYLNRADMHGNGQPRQDRFAVSLNTDYELYSMGKDGSSSAPIAALNSQDDVLRAGNGSYLGLAKLF